MKIVQITSTRGVLIVLGDDGSLWSSNVIGQWKELPGPPTSGVVTSQPLVLGKPVITSIEASGARACASCGEREGVADFDTGFAHVALCGHCRKEYAAEKRQAENIL